MFGSGKLSSIADSKFENNFSHSEIVWLKKFYKKVQNLFYAPYTKLIDKSYAKKGELFNHIRVQLVSTDVWHQRAKVTWKERKKNGNNNIENKTRFLENSSKFFSLSCLTEVLKILLSEFEVVSSLQRESKLNLLVSPFSRTS